MNSQLPAYWPYPGRLWSALRIFLLVSATLAASACGAKNGKVALGTLERDTIRLTAPASEIITRIYVKEGDQVEPGNPILQLDNRVVQAEVARASANLERAHAFLVQLQNGALEEEVASARARVASAKANAEAQEKSYQRTLNLVEKSLVEQAELDNAEARRDSANAALEDASEQLELLRRGTRVEQIEQARAQVEEASQAYAIARKHAGDYYIVATRNGRVDSLPWNEGERVNAGAVVAVLLADGNPYVRAYMPESSRAQLEIGQTFEVAVDGVERTFTGTLSRVQKDPAFSPHFALTETERSRLMYLVEVQLDASAGNLPSGIPAQVKLHHRSEKQ